MPFPQAERVIYDNAPLITVISQLRFPTILEIDKNIPDAFQNKIRQEYPILEEQRDIPNNISKELLSILPQNKQRELIRATGSNYAFLTRDRKWKVNLTSKFVALSTLDYSRWEEFKERLDDIVDALVEVYRPAFFSRIGLRYQNIIEREKIGLEGVPWSELLKAHIAGALAVPEVARNVFSVDGQLDIILGNGISMVRVLYGSLTNDETGNECYLLDNDFYTELETEVADVGDKLAYFNEKSRNLFRWSIEDRLHEALGPQSVG